MLKNENKKGKIADVQWYIAYNYTDVDFIDPDYFPPLWNGTQLLTFLQFNMPQTECKTAICNKQIAVFYLTKNLYFRLKVAVEYFDTITRSVGCRSPPSFLILRNSKIRSGGNQNARG